MPPAAMADERADGVGQGFGRFVIRFRSTEMQTDGHVRCNIMVNYMQYRNRLFRSGKKPADQEVSIPIKSS